MGELSLCQLVMSAICANAGSKRPRNSTEGINLVQGIQALPTNLICPWIELWMSINLILRSLLFSFFQRQRLRRRKHHLLSENWANPMAARDWGARWWFLQFTSFFHQISSSDHLFIFLVFFQMSWSGAVFQFCLHFLLKNPYEIYLNPISLSAPPAWLNQMVSSRRYLDLHNSRSILKSML